MQLFQAGHSLAVQRARRGRALEEKAGGLLDRATQAVLVGLLERP
jgi:hypothetical protein